MQDKKAPVREGEEHKVEVESVGEKGDGIARVKGFVLFIKNTKKGDYVKVKITKVLQNVGFAEVVEKLEKADKPVRKRKRFVTVSREEMEREEEYQPSQHYDDTEDFGDDLEDQ